MAFHVIRTSVLSPSSRRAWIEISPIILKSVYVIVALLAEGVDRNASAGAPEIDKVGSPSSRRAWIEILPAHHRSFLHPVALLAEGVDRNEIGDYSTACGCGRPPRGGRG